MRWSASRGSDIAANGSIKMGKFLAEQRTKIQSLLDLRDIACYGSRCSPDHTAVVCNTGTVNVEASQDLGYALIEAKNDLDMTRWIR